MSTGETSPHTKESRCHRLQALELPHGAAEIIANELDLPAAADVGDRPQHKVGLLALPPRPPRAHFCGDFAAFQQHGWQWVDMLEREHVMDDHRLLFEMPGGASAGQPHQLS
eukprot:11767916-Alexandrium_andersonii.AAC.1